MSVCSSTSKEGCKNTYRVLGFPDILFLHKLIAFAQCEIWIYSIDVVKINSVDSDYILKFNVVSVFLKFWVSLMNKHQQRPRLA